MRVGPEEEPGPTHRVLPQVNLDIRLTTVLPPGECPKRRKQSTRQSQEVMVDPQELICQPEGEEQLE